MQLYLAAFDCERITAAASMELRLACLLYAVGLCRAHALVAKRNGNVTLAFDALLAKDHAVTSAPRREARNDPARSTAGKDSRAEPAVTIENCGQSPVGS